MIFYKQNTGALDAQDYKCDYFKIGKKSEDDGVVEIALKFYRHEIDAVEDKTPYRTFKIIIPEDITKTFPTISSAVDWMFAQPKLTATSGVEISIQAPSVI